MVHKIKILILSAFISVLTFAGYYVSKQSDQVKVQEVISLPVETEAFTAVKQQNNWVISLKSQHYPTQIKSVAVIYNDTFYGVFLLSDKIYLPVLVATSAQLTISTLDIEGKPLISESFTLGEANEEIGSRTPKGT